MNPKASQVFRIRTETLAHSPLLSQGTSPSPDRLQELVQVAEVVVEDAAPGEDRDRPGKRPGDDQERPVEAALGEPLVVEQEGEGEADDEAEDRAQQRERERPLGHHPERVEVDAEQHLAVVREPDPVELVEMGEAVVVRERDVEAVGSADDRRQSDEEEPRQDVRVGVCALACSCESRRPVRRRGPRRHRSSSLSRVRERSATLLGRAPLGLRTPSF